MQTPSANRNLQGSANAPDLEATLRLLLDYAPVALAMFDRQMRYLAVSARWLADYGLRGQDVLGRSHYDVLPEIPLRWRAVHERGLQGSVESAEEDPFLRADGTTQWLRWEVRPWHAATGEIGGIFIFTEDITSRKQAQEERERLRLEISQHAQQLQAERRFRALLESAPDAMVIADPTGKIVLANSQAEKMFGYTRSELLEQPLDVLVPERFRRDHVAHRERFLAERRMRKMGSGLELYALRKDGGEIPVEISLAILETEDGPLVSSAIRDVSERKKSEEALARLAAIVESAEDAIIGKDLDGVIQSWNPAAERMFGYSAPEIIGKNIGVLVPADRKDEERQILEKIRCGERVEPYETVRQRKDGTLVEVLLTASPVKDRRGAVSGASTITRDLTERKKLERKLRDEARTDSVTGIATRRYFLELAQREFARMRRHGGAMSVVALDVDRFKDINDQFGHAVGDQILKALSRECLGALREEDVLGRLGGDEFAVLLPETAIDRAAQVGERMRLGIASAALPLGTGSTLQFTVSIGVATMAPDDVSLDALLLRADKAMYAAKRSGRNTVRVDLAPTPREGAPRPR